MNETAIVKDGVMAILNGRHELPPTECHGS